MADKKKFASSFKVYRPVDLSQKWFVYYYENGKRIRKYGRINQFSTWSEREEEAQRLIKELQQQLPEPLKDRLSAWLINNRGLWRRKTYRTYKSKLDNLFSFLGPDQITRANLDRFFSSLSTNVHRTTYNAYRAQLKQIFEGVGAMDVFPSIEKRKAHQTPAKYFQDRQVKRLKKEIYTTDPELWFACQCIYYCFLRPNSELRLLKVGDINPDHWLIRIEGVVSKNGKTEYVSIPEAFRKDVVAYIDGKKAGAWLFPGRQDPSKPLGYNTLGKRHRKILTRLGFGTDYKFYSWKHTGAVACVRAGVNVKDLQVQLRHHSLEMVDRYLRQLGINDLEDLTSKFPKL